MPPPTPVPLAINNNTMQLTEAQNKTKQAIIETLLTIKKNSHANILLMQKQDMGEATETREEEHNVYETGKISQSLNRVEARAGALDSIQRDINILSNLEAIDPTEEVQLGDVLETDQGNFFVAVAADDFEVDGVTYRGISTDSPLFQALAGKQNGDKVTLNGNSFTLKNSY